MKKIRIALILFFAGCGLQLSAQFQLATQATVRMTLISPNGNWIAGYDTEAVAQRWNKRTGIYNSFDGAYNLSYINNNGDMAGSQDDAAVAYFGGEWHLLPLPDVTVVLSNASYISENADTIAGYMQYYITAEDFVTLPVLWTIKDNYVYGNLMEYSVTDIFGVTAQGTLPVTANADGSVLLGRYVDYSGMHELPVVWRKNAAGEYVLKVLGKEQMFPDAALLPPCPEYRPTPDVNDYLTAADSARFDNLSEQYDDCVLNGGSDCGNQPTYKDVLTADSLAAYRADSLAASNYVAELQVWNDSISSLWSGYTFDTYGMSISGNGKYVGMTAYYIADKTSSTVTESAVLVYFDTETGVMHQVANVSGDVLLMSVNNNGDLIYIDPYLEGFSQSYVLPANTTTPVEMTQWVKNNYGYDVSGDLRFTDTANNIVDSLITGQCQFSGDGGTILGFFRQAVNDTEHVPSSGVFSYVINLEDFTDNKLVWNSEENVSIYPNPVQNEIILSRAVDTVELLDMTGRKITELSGTDGRIKVEGLQSGTYLLRLTFDGNQCIRKIVKK